MSAAPRPPSPRELSDAAQLVRWQLAPFRLAARSTLDDPAQPESERLAASSLLAFLDDLDSRLDYAQRLAASWAVYR